MEVAGSSPARGTKGAGDVVLRVRFLPRVPDFCGHPEGVDAKIFGNRRNRRPEPPKGGEAGSSAKSADFDA